MTHISRRDFVKTTAAAAAIPTIAGAAFARTRRSRDTLRVGLIGCGGRGTGAAAQALGADPDAVLWSMADAWAPKVSASLDNLREAVEPDGPEAGASSRLEVPESRQFAGLDAYKQVIDSGVDVVLLATPPAFRPAHLRAAVEAGKHIFSEKPVAVDGPGVRSAMESARMAKEKGLSLRSGFCWRFNGQVREAMDKVAAGQIGDIRAIYTTYNAGGWVEPRVRQPDEATYHWMVRNWHYFYSISGDHIVEQAIHAIDWMNWLMGDKPPIKCHAVGGRQCRPMEPEYGNVWDHFSAVFEYPEGVRGFHMCRHWPNTPFDNTAKVMGADGVLNMSPWDGRHTITGKRPWKGEARDNETGKMYQTEHNELFAAIRSGKHVNDGDYLASSTLLAIMARQAAYTGQDVSWEQALNLQDDLNPQPWDFDQDREIRPMPVPGRTKLV
ncbi:MAG: Gfo/Idh/MocA family protein [Phycisphaerales bacterium JB039]